MKKKNLLKILAPALLVSMLGAAALASRSSAVGLEAVSSSGKTFLDYESFGEAREAAKKLNQRISEEGNVLLKNDGSLPLRDVHSVSVFGETASNLVSTHGRGASTTTIPTAFADAGYSVNQKLVDAYAASAATGQGKEGAVEFDKGVEASFDLYNDLAVIVVSRAGSEMNDLDPVHVDGGMKGDYKPTALGDFNNGKNEIEDETYLGEDQGWEHEDLYEDESGHKYRHELQLTNSEQKLVKYVEGKGFRNIVFVINCSASFEITNLMKDENINGILWISRPGEEGTRAIPEILSGRVNPSGKTVDVWAADFSADPTWKNFGDNAHQGVYPYYLYPDGTSTKDLLSTRYDGLHGVDYEEDIYLGYKYYETYYHDINEGLQAIPAGYGENRAAAAEAWYKDHVIAPFGYGLSYTSFSLNIKGAYVDEACSVSFASAMANPADFASSIDAEGVKTTQKYEDVFVKVEVENTGDYAGKEVVELYVEAPYDPASNSIEKPSVRLVGFEKTKELAPGRKQTVVIKAKVQDFASYDYSDANKNGKSVWELDAGDYKFIANESSHYDLTADEANEKDAQDTLSFTVSETIVQQLDDFSHNEVKNLFSDRYDDSKKATSKWNSLRQNTGSALRFNLSETAGMTTMNRKAGFVASFPEAPTVDDMTMSQIYVDETLLSAQFDASFLMGDSKESLYKDEKREWHADVNVPSTWTQAEQTKEGLNDIILADMTGIDYDSDEVIAEGKFQGKTGREAWELFMNQLSHEELVSIVQNGSFQTAAIPSVNKEAGSDQDNPKNLASTYGWADGPMIASTWNKDLAKQQGIIVANLGILNGNTGWYGPGLNTHRSPFSGRNNDYYSEDGILAGYIGNAVIQGSRSRGLNVFVKHFAMNDEETFRNAMCLFVWGSEQAFRENYLKPFQMAFQEGGALGGMSSFSRICGDSCNVNYRMETALARKEWGFKGVFITDAQPGTRSIASTDMMIRAGNDLMLSNNTGGDRTAYANGYNVWRPSGSWDPTLRDGKGGIVLGGDKDWFGNEKNFYYTERFKAANAEGEKVLTDHVSATLEAPLTDWYAQRVNGHYVASDVTKESTAQYYFLRNCATHIFYMTANSMMAKNGTVLGEWKASKAIEATQGVAVNDNVSLTAEQTGNSDKVGYAITSGSLPEGVVLNGATGTLTGTPLTSGKFEAEITATIDGWIKASRTVTIDVASAIALSGECVGKVGDEFYLAIESDTVKVSEGGYESVTYALSEGVLPAGLSFSEAGTIEGTATEAGEFPIVIEITAKQGKATDVYHVSATIVVADDTIASILAKIEELGTKIDALTGTEAADKSALEAEITALKTEVAALDETIKAAEESQDIEALTASLKTLTEKIAALEGQVKTLSEKSESSKSTTSGCGGSVAAASLTAMALAISAITLIIKKKKED